MTILSDQAKFTINGTPAEDPVTGDPGFDGTHSQTLTLTLENSPSGALAVTYEVYDPTDGNSPLASKDAPLLTFVDSGTARQYLTNPNGNATIILPGSGVHSYTFRCTAHFDGDDHVFERVVSIRTTTLLPNVRKLVPAESTQYAAQTWSETQNEIVDALSAAAFIAGSVNYQGTWNANTNTPALASGVGTKGYYYVVSVAGTTNLDGITDWEQNDWAIFNGTVWQKVDNSDIYWWDRTGTVLAPLMTGDTVSIPGTDSVVTLLSVVQTPPAPTTNIVTSIEAQGTNWAAGSRVLQLISDDADAVPLAINDGAADVLTVSRGAVIARDSGTITVQTTTSGNIVIDSAAVVDINAATTVTIDATAGQVSIDAAQSSNFSVSGASQALTLSATGGTNASVIINTNGAPTNAVDINATAGGVEIDAAKASHFVVAGADLTLQTTGSGDVIADGAANVLLNVATSTVMTISATGATMAAGATINEFSTDGTLGGASDTALPTERAVKTYVDTTAAAAAAGVSLDDAYDSGGAGAGRTITADTGAVNIVDDDTTAGLLTVVQTPTGGIVETVVSLESQGTNWSSGSRVLQIVSDDNDAVPFVVNNGASDVAGITRTGAIGAGMLPSTAMLEVKSSGVSSNALRIENSEDTDALLLVTQDSSDHARLYLYDASANVGVRLCAGTYSYIDSGGNLGIGTAADSGYRLEVQVDSDTAYSATAVPSTQGAMIYNAADGAVHDTFSSLVLNARADAKNSVIAFNAIQPDDTLSGSELAIQRRTDSDTYAESVRIDKIGSVGVNTMTPGTWANAPVPTASMLHVQTDTSTTGSYLPALYVVGAGDADDSGVMARFGTANDRGLEIKAGRRISDQAHVDFGVVTADGAARHTLTLIQETGGTVTRIGGRMTAPEFDFHTMQDENALSGTDVDVSELGFVVTRYANDNNHAVGIGFGNSTDTSNVGAAIIHERVGGESQGKLHFATKDTAIADDDIPIVFTLDEAGKAGLGITSPLTELHVQTADLGTGWDDTDASAQIAAVGDDAGVTIVSTDAGTWGSAISFAQVDGTVFENKWAIGRQTNGDGSGDGSLHVQYGTDARGMRNTSVLAISSAGVVTSYYGGVVKDDMNWAFGDDSNAAIQYDTTQTPDSWLFGVSTDSNALIVCQKADMGYDFAHALETDPTVFIQSANQSATEWRSFTHNQTDAYSGIGSGSHVTNHEAPVLLADDASFTLPADSYGWGTFYFHNDGSYAQVAWAADGTVTLIANSANVDDADTDTYYCIYDAGSNTVAVKNRIGASRYVMFDYHYSTATYA